MLELLLNGAGSDQALLIMASDGTGFPGTLNLRTTGGPDLYVTLRTAAESAAALVFDQPQVQVTAAGAAVQVHATGTSGALNDTIIEAVAGTNVLAQLRLTAVQDPLLRYAGRFQCRLATDPDPYDDPWGQVSSFGMYAVQGPDPAMPDEPPLDRIIRLNDPVALRPFSEPVGTAVTAIEARVGADLVSFRAGDPVIGLPVDLGANSKFESQNNVFAPVGLEPISDFEFRVGTAFFGRSAPAAPRRPGEPPTSTAPYADGFVRLDVVGPWKPSDFGYGEATWEARSLAVTAAKLTALTGQNPGSAAEGRIRDRRLLEHTNNLSGIQFCLPFVERYTGLIDRDLSITPSDSPMLQYLARANRFAFRCEFFNFDTDTHCGTVTGTLGVA